MAAFGAQALGANTSGAGSTGLGFRALRLNTTGGNNTAVGYDSMYTNTTGSNNTAVGVDTLKNNTTGDLNVAVGLEALKSSTTASNNTAVGYIALTDCTTGGNNTALGRKALTDLTTGYTNTAVGYDCGDELTTGTNNSFFGYQAGTSSSPATQHTGSNIVVIGNNSITAAYIKVGWTTGSDRRDKTDITPFTHGLSWINKLNPVTYRWDNRSFYADGSPDGSKKQSQLNVGLIAQDELEVEKEHGYGDSPENMLVSTFQSDKYGMQYEKLIPVLINAVKELSAKVTALEGG
jgi:hypothetical protein